MYQGNGLAFKIEEHLKKKEKLEKAVKEAPKGDQGLKIDQDPKIDLTIDAKEAPQEDQVKVKKKISLTKIRAMLPALQLRIERVRYTFIVMEALVKKVPTKLLFVQQRQMSINQDMNTPSIYLDLDNTPKNFNGEDLYTPETTVIKLVESLKDIEYKIR